MLRLSEPAQAHKLEMVMYWGDQLRKSGVRLSRGGDCGIQMVQRPEPKPQMHRATYGCAATQSQAGASQQRGCHTANLDRPALCLLFVGEDCAVQKPSNTCPKIQQCTDQSKPWAPQKWSSRVFQAYPSWQHACPSPAPCVGAIEKTPAHANRPRRLR